MAHTLGLLNLRNNTAALSGVPYVVPHKHAEIWRRASQS